MIDLRGFARKTGGAQLAQGGSVFTDANRALGDGQEPIQSPHPLAGLADLLKNAANPTSDNPVTVAQPQGVIDTSTQTPLTATLPLRPEVQPQPNLDLSGLAQGQGPQGVAQIGGPQAGRLNTRPDPTADPETYRRQVNEYKPEDHNGRLKSIIIQAIRGLADGYNRTGSVAGALSGAAVGGIAGGVDPSQDEYFHNENYAKPRSFERVKEQLGIEKEKAGIVESEADAAWKQQQAIEAPLKREEAARKARVQSLQKQLQLVLGKGQGLNRSDPQAARLIAALEKEGLDTPDLDADIVRAVPIHDDVTGEDFWETTSKDGTVRRTSTGGSHTSATKAGRDEAARRQLVQQEFQKAQQERAVENAIRVKQTPGAKAVGSGGGSGGGRSGGSSSGATNPHADAVPNDEKMLETARKYTLPIEGESDAKYAKRVAATYKQLAMRSDAVVRGEAQPMTKKEIEKIAQDLADDIVDAIPQK